MTIERKVLCSEHFEREGQSVESNYLVSQRL